MLIYYVVSYVRKLTCGNTAVPFLRLLTLPPNGTSTTTLEQRFGVSRVFHAT